MHQTSVIEMLEGRIAPASVLVYTDVDGDKVTIKSTKGDLTNHVVFEDIGAGKQLTELKLNEDQFKGTNLTIKVKKSGNGDGFANVGYINASGVDLGKVKVAGDIGRIDAGDGNSAKPAIKSLIAKSLGAFGSTTQAGGGGGGGGGGGNIPIDEIRTLLTDLVSIVNNTASGTLGTLLTTINDLLGSGGVVDPELQHLLEALGSDINTLVGLGADGLNDVTGGVQSLLSNISTTVNNLITEGTGTLEPAVLTLLDTVQDQVNEIVFKLTEPLGFGGTIDNPLQNALTTIDDLLALLSGPVTSVPDDLLTTLDGSVDGLLTQPGGLVAFLVGLDPGLITTVQNLLTGVNGIIDDPLTPATFETLLTNLQSLSDNLTTALNGTLTTAARDALTATKTAVDNILALPQAALDDLNVDLGDLSDLLTNSLPDTLPDGVQTIVDNVLGLLSGITDNIDDALTNGGSLLGSTLEDLGQVHTQLISLLGTIGDDLTPEAVTLINSVVHQIFTTIGTVLDDGGGGGGAGGGESDVTLQSHILGNIGSIKISKDVSNIFLNVAGGIKNLMIKGSLIGGASANSGEIFATGDIGNVKIGKSILGGLNLNSGLIQSSGLIKTAKIGGSIVGGVGNGSGELLMTSDSKLITVKHDIIGNTGLFAAAIDNTNGRIGTLKVGGSVISGQNTDSGTIRVQGDIGLLQIKGNLIGDADSEVVISAAATKNVKPKSDLGFKTIIVGGRTSFATILAGYDTELDAVNSHAQIGTVKIGGDWIASNLVAGAIPSDSGGIEDFGTSTDKVIPNGVAGTLLSKIASIQIKGSVIGTNGDTTDHFGFVAQEIGKFKVGKNKLTLSSGSGNDGIKLSQGTGSDVTVHEIGATIPV